MSRNQIFLSLPKEEDQVAVNSLSSKMRYIVGVSQLISGCGFRSTFSRGVPKMGMPIPKRGGRIRSTSLILTVTPLHTLCMR